MKQTAIASRETDIDELFLAHRYVHARGLASTIYVTKVVLIKPSVARTKRFGTHTV